MIEKRIPIIFFNKMILGKTTRATLKLQLINKQFKNLRKLNFASCDASFSSQEFAEAFHMKVKEERMFFEYLIFCLGLFYI